MAEVRQFRNGRITFFGRELAVLVDARTRGAMESIVLLTEQKVKTLISESPRGGRSYRVGKTRKRRGRGRIHKASAPGEPPAVRTSRLFTSIRSAVQRKTDGIQGLVGTNVKYSTFLEEGTRLMRPRPVWRRALKELEGDIQRIFSRAGS